MEWTIGGITYEWSPDWWQAWGAILQAILTAAAVFAASSLQDRGLAKRDEAVRAQRLEGIAAVARYVNSVFAGLTQKMSPAMHPSGFHEVFPPGYLSAARRALAEIEPAQIGDLQLTGLFLRLEQTFEVAAQRLFALSNRAELARTETLRAQGVFGDSETIIFNAASAVERRVAEIVGRRPEL